MKYSILFLFFVANVFAQRPDTITKKALKAEIKLYKVYNLKNDTIIVDTTLTIQNDYNYNYLRKDNFGLLPFANEGYLYTNLDFSKKSQSFLPQFGFSAKHQSYQSKNDINYYSVPTPVTNLYFKTVMRQGQSLDALLTINTKPNLNFTVAYKAIRSIGEYFNNLTSSGHFRFTSSYFSKNKKYILNTHFVGQDIFNQENGGVRELSQLNGTNSTYNQRERVDVYFNDASSKLKGNRFFIDHNFKLKQHNSLTIKHQMFYENKFYEFLQTTSNQRLGNSLYPSVNNKTYNNVFYNKAGLGFVTKRFGELFFFIENNNQNQYFRDFTDIFTSFNNYLHNRVTTIGGQYDYLFKKWNFHFLLQNAISNLPTSNIQAFAKYNFSDIHFVKISAEQSSKLPDNIFQINRSDYDFYNWNNSFKNVNTSKLFIETKNKYFEANLTFSNIQNHLFFANIQNNLTVLRVNPFQFQKNIQYLGAEIIKEIKYKKWALNNRLKYQKVNQDNNVLNVPQIITRNTLYFTDKVFKKAMLLQTGFTLNYFTKYYADDYTPVIGDFYTQNQTKVGAFPILDFFVNARVQQCRIYLKAEHFNSLFSKNITYYNTPNYPFRDFVVRFGLEWTFFQ